MAKRKRNRGTWLPLLPTFIGESDVGLTYYDGTLTFPNTVLEGDTTVIALPLTLDETPDVDNASGIVTLRDMVEGQDYICDRVVGNVWASVPANAERIGEILFCCALAVLPVDDNVPTNPSIQPEDYNPFFAQNAQAPWYYRRVWHLRNPAFGDITGPHEIGMMGYTGSIIDTMGVKRRIGKEQRLFLVAAAAVLSHGGASSSDFVRFGYDVRVFGHMVKGRNKSTFK